MEKTHKIDTVVLLAGAIFPVVIRFLFPDLFHHFDVTTFVQWGGYADNMSDLYLTDCYCNYPYVGMLLSTGVLRLFGDSIFAFLLFLAFIDLINVFIVRKLLILLKIPRANLIAGAIGLLPAVWVGGNLWGQIDNIGQTFILLLLISFLVYIKSNGTKIFYLIASGVIISLSLLTKQLLVFPLAPIGLALVVFILSRGENLFSKLKSLVVLGASVLLPIILIDLYLPIGEQYYFSHFERVILEGSDHMNIISGNGFNIWMLFFNDMYHDSSIPLFAGLSPKLLGMISFVLLFLITLYFYIKKERKNTNWRITMFNLIFFFLITNIGFNLLLTGTHERYLYYFFPYLVIYLFMGYQLKKFNVSTFDLTVALFGAAIYGYFVFGILKRYHIETEFFSSLMMHKIMAVITLIIFIDLIYRNKAFYRLKD